jgi:mannose-6-phosphate isomerase-like protein (cupin superfamily)
MSTGDRSGVIRVASAQAAVPGPAGEHAVSVLRRGTLNALLALGRFAPRPAEPASHAQDEVYVVISGRGVFVHDGERDAFEAGDLLFVAAGTAHRFEDVSDDLAVWAIFYGPRGGETPLDLNPR